MRFCHDPTRPCDFVIVGTDRISFVSIHRIRKIHSTIADIVQEYGWAIEKICRIPAISGSVSRELWLCSYYGTWRFFRITDASPVELAPDGNLPALPVQDMAPPPAAVPVGGQECRV
jgi:hypothetical protein